MPPLTLGVEETMSQSMQSERTARLRMSGVIVLAAGVGLATAACESGTSKDVNALSERILALESRLASADKLSARVDALERNAPVVPSLAASGFLTLGNPDTYDSLGPFWQVTRLALQSDPQGCRVTGQILYRLSVRRQNVDMSVDLLNDRFATVASGKGVLASAMPGRYTNFSVLVRTDAKLSELTTARITLDENSGTTGAF